MVDRDPSWIGLPLDVARRAARRSLRLGLPVWLLVAVPGAAVGCGDDEEPSVPGSAGDAGSAMSGKAGKGGTSAGGKGGAAGKGGSAGSSARGGSVNGGESGSGESESGAGGQPTEPQAGAHSGGKGGGHPSTAGETGDSGSGGEGGENLTEGQRLERLEEEGKLPKLDRSTALAGPDDDTNSIRDDIDQYAATQGYTAPQLAAIQQLARGLNEAVSLASPTPETAKPIAQKVGRALHCVWSRFDDAPTALSVGRTYQKLTANTEARVRAYLQFNRALDGALLTSPRGDTCEN